MFYKIIKEKSNDNLKKAIPKEHVETIFNEIVDSKDLEKPVSEILDMWKKKLASLDDEL
jgi:hypothetical protein